MSKRDAFDDADGDVWLARERAGGALLARDRRIRGGGGQREKREDEVRGICTEERVLRETALTYWRTVRRLPVCSPRVHSEIQIEIQSGSK